MSGYPLLVFRLVLASCLAASLLAIAGRIGRGRWRRATYRRLPLFLFSLTRNAGLYAGGTFAAFLLGMASHQAMRTVPPEVFRGLVFFSLGLLGLVWLGSLVIMVVNLGTFSMREARTLTRAKGCRPALIRLVLVLGAGLGGAYVLLGTSSVVGILQTGLRQCSVILFGLVVPLGLVGLIHGPRRAIWRHLVPPAAGDREAGSSRLGTAGVTLRRIFRRVQAQFVRGTRFCLILGGEEADGGLSDLRSQGLRRAFSVPRDRALYYPGLLQVQETIRLFTDFDRSLFLADPGDGSDSGDEAAQSVLENEGLRAIHAFRFRFEPQIRLYLLDSLDAEVMRSRAPKAFDFDAHLAARLTTVYLVCDPEPDPVELGTFRRLLAANGLLRGVLLCRPCEAAPLPGEGAGAECLALVGRGREGVLETVRESERRQLVVGGVRQRSLLGHRVDLQRALEEVVAAERDEEDGPREARTEVIIERHGDRLLEDLGKGLEDPAPGWAEWKGALGQARLAPARRLIRCMAHEDDLPTRVYIQFNVLEMMAKALTFFGLSARSDGEASPDDVVTGSRRPHDPGRLVDHADDARWLYELARSPVPSSGPLATLHRVLQSPVAVDLDEGLERLRVLFPFIERPRVSTLAEIFLFSSFLRNTVRGHGVVTNPVAAVSYPILLNILDEVVGATRTLRLDEADPGPTARVILDGESVPCPDLLRYDDAKGDWLFRIGFLKGVPVFLGYVSGQRYRPRLVSG